MAADSMMGGVMGLGWVLVLAGLGLLIGGIVFLARPRPAQDRPPGKVLTVLAMLGGVALVVVVAIGSTHLGLRCC